MQTVKSNKILYCDVDGTLLMYNGNDGSFSAIDKQSIAIKCPFTENRDDHAVAKYYYLRPNHNTIQYLKDYKAMGYTIVVWSAASWVWAEAAVKALKLEDIVDYVMSKPDVVIDDLEPNEWIREQIWPR